MSYHESPAPITADAVDALFVAIVEVCENSFFAFVESCEPDRFDALVERMVPLVEQTPSPPPKRRGRRSGRAALPRPQTAAARAHHAGWDRRAADYELLEMLLLTHDPREDVKSLAEALIDQSCRNG